MNYLIVIPIKVIVPDAWYKGLLGEKVRVIERYGDYLVLDPSLYLNNYGMEKNSGIIAKDDCIVLDRKCEEDYE